MKNDRKGGSMRNECTTGPNSSPSIPVLSSSDLLQGATEIRIDHGGEMYRLRQTRQGKLILTK